LFHFFLRRRFLRISFDPDGAERDGWRVRWWDFLFYVSFGIAVTLSVPVAGVLMVFTMLVVPAVIAFLFTKDIRRMVFVSWGAGTLASLLGLWLSYVGNFPTGPLIVCMYGLLLLVVGGLRWLGVVGARTTA
jgi:zinc/manganese transport system permease protein